MIRAKLKVLSIATLLLLMVSCHPEGCYGPGAFNYNRATVAASDLVGIYTFDGTNASVLNRLGFTNHSGFISLQPDKTFVCSNVPCVVGIPKPGVYLSSSGKWRPVQTAARWEVELYDGDLAGMAGWIELRLPVLGNSPPYGIQWTINHDEGYWVRYRHSRELP